MGSWPDRYRKLVADLPRRAAALLAQPRRRGSQRAMPMLTRLLLICVLVVTSLGLGAARGQLRLGGEVVLCAGGAVLVVQTLGPDAEARAGRGQCPMVSSTAGHDLVLANDDHASTGVAELAMTRAAVATVRRRRRRG